MPKFWALFFHSLSSTHLDSVELFSQQERVTSDFLFFFPSKAPKWPRGFKTAQLPTAMYCVYEMSCRDHADQGFKNGAHFLSFSCSSLKKLWICILEKWKTFKGLMMQREGSLYSGSIKRSEHTAQCTSWIWNSNHHSSLWSLLLPTQLQRTQSLDLFLL